MDATRRSHLKLLASEFLSLSGSRKGGWSSFSRGGMPVHRVETVGVIVARSLKPDKLVEFAVDDGTGCVPCVLWINDETSPYYAKYSLPTARQKAQMSKDFASVAQLGVVARVRGEVKGYRGNIQIVVSDVVLETDPNAQILHWVECVMLARNCYDKLSLHSLPLMFGESISSGWQHGVGASCKGRKQAPHEQRWIKLLPIMCPSPAMWFASCQCIFLLILLANKVVRSKTSCRASILLCLSSIDK